MRERRHAQKKGKHKALGVLDKIFGTRNEREIKHMTPVVGEIGALEPQMHALSDEQLRATTDEFRSRIRQRVESIVDPPEADLHQLTG